MAVDDPVIPTGDFISVVQAFVRVHATITNSACVLGVCVGVHGAVVW